ncbi:MAG: VOC family protein [Alphaproteobacteria bacterium]
MENRIGSIVWNELQTKEVELMKNFHQNLFGYLWHDVPIDEKLFYHIGMQDEAPALAIVQLPPFIANAGGQSFNIYYIATNNLTAQKEKAVSLGARVIVDEVMMENVGRWSIILDPFGAAFCLIEMQERPTSMGKNQAGHYWWHEVIAKDAKASALFYGQLFDWKIEEVQTGENLYYIAKNTQNNEDIRIGFYPMDERLKAANMNDFWLGFVYCDNVDELCQKAQNNGATILLDPHDDDIIGCKAWLLQPDNSILGVVSPKIVE